MRRKEKGRKNKLLTVKLLTSTQQLLIYFSFHIYTFSDIKLPLLHTFSDINPPQSYTFSEIKANKSYIFSEIRVLFREKGNKISTL